jgi:hypothetical protein
MRSLCPGRFPCPASCLAFAVHPGRSDTKPSFYSSGSIELSGTQSRGWYKGSEGSGVQRSLPVTAEVHDTSWSGPRNGPGLRARVRNLESPSKQNADNARCVCWILRNITDPEAIDSAIRLAGTIRWFDGDSDHDPPFDLIVSTFEACFDSTKQLYPGMRDRAYFSARAILQINTGARAQSRERASKYPIPAVPRIHHNTPTLTSVMSSACSTVTWKLPDRPTLDFPRVGTNTHRSRAVDVKLVCGFDPCGTKPNPEILPSPTSAQPPPITKL